MNPKDNDPHRYDDMLHLSRPVSAQYPPMSRRNRAAQFAPFAALTGYEAAVQETARLTQTRTELDEESRMEIDGVLQLLRAQLPQRPEVCFTYFEPDGRKAGGCYVTVQGIVKKLDTYDRVIQMENGTKIPIDEIIAASIDLSEEME